MNHSKYYKSKDTGNLYWTDGDYYISDEDRAEAFCQKLWGQALEDAHAEDEDCVYYTEWC